MIITKHLTPIYYSKYVNNEDHEKVVNQYIEKHRNILPFFIDNVKPSTIRLYFAYAKVLEHDYNFENIINMSIGAPQIPLEDNFIRSAADRIVSAAKKAGNIFGYDPATGLDKLRNHLAVLNLVENKTLLEKEKEKIVKIYNDKPGLYDRLMKSSAKNGFKFERNDKKYIKQIIGCEKHLSAKQKDSDYANRNLITITNGVTHGIFATLHALCPRPVLSPEPGFMLYDMCMTAATNRHVIQIPCNEKDGYKMSLRAFEKEARPGRVLIMNSPCNPTGAVYEPDELEKIAKIAKEKEMIIIADDIYSTFTYEKEFRSLYDILPDQTILLNGFSKGAAMPNIRIGYILRSRNFNNFVVEKCKVNKGFSVDLSAFCMSAGVSNPSQQFAITFMKDYLWHNHYHKWVEPVMLTPYNKARKKLREGLEKFRKHGIFTYGLEGAFYAFLNIEGFFKKYRKGMGIILREQFDKYPDVTEKEFHINLKDERTNIKKCEYYKENKQKLQRDILFAMLNLLHAKTVTIPGTDFYMTPDDTHIRLAYPPSEDKIIEYMERLENLVTDVASKN